MTIRTKICPCCGGHFSYAIGKGRDRKYCGEQCLNVMRKRLAKQSRSSWPKCSTDGCDRQVRARHAKYCNPCYGKRAKASAGICQIHKCDRPATRRGGTICEMHYGRLRRNGSTQTKGRLHVYKTAAGYIKVFRPGHRLADSSGLVFEHRLVALDGLESCACRWCGKQLSVRDAVVDHLNEVKSDNRPENLVISCNDCNRARGAMVPFVRRLRADAVDLLVERIKALATDQS